MQDKKEGRPAMETAFFFGFFRLAGAYMYLPQMAFTRLATQK
jgi:hypothetical protein